MITKDEILMGRDKKYPEEYTKEISDNIDKLLKAILPAAFIVTVKLVFGFYLFILIYSTISCSELFI